MKELYQAFGRRLRRQRLRAELSQEQLGRRVGLSRTSITNMETGLQHVSLHHLFDLANALGVEPGNLLPDGSEAVEEEIALPTKVIAHLRKLPEEDRAWVMRMVRGDGTRQEESR